METFRCTHCGQEHDLGEIEPSFDRPDAYFEIPEAERSKRSWNSESFCVIWESDSSQRRHFLRVVLPIPVRGEAKSYSWGIWVEVDEADFAAVHDHWLDRLRCELPPLTGRVANRLPTMDDTLGLEGFVTSPDLESVPVFHLAPASRHDLAREQREGVYPERMIEWAARAAHL